jgi:hypothetical protein
MIPIVAVKEFESGRDIRTVTIFGSDQSPGKVAMLTDYLSESRYRCFVWDEKYPV